MRLIALDIGNTAVTYGIFEKGRLKQHGSVLHDDIPKYIKKWSVNGVKTKNQFIVSSVVPKITRNIKRQLSGSGIKLWIIGGNLSLPLRHKYRSLKKLGADRVLNIYGALHLHKAPLLILDFGTAITADYVSPSGVFEGGMIIPGPEIAFQSLVSRAALLPKKAKLPLKTPSFLGRDTYRCMKSGILEGYGSMVDGLVERFKSRYGRRIKVLATGGFARHLKPYTRSFDLYDPLHSLKSLCLAHRKIT